MKLSTPKYTFCLFFQLVFMLCDLIFNCVSLFSRNRDSLIVLFIFQDLFLVLSITMFMMTLFSTYLFQAGLLEALARRFRLSLCVSAAYALASVCAHALAVGGGGVAGRWALAGAHYALAPAHYALYKRAALAVADPRLHDDVDWLHHNPHP